MPTRGYTMTEDDDRLALAAHMRDVCIEAALAGYEDAAIAGLCGEGALEVAISAIRRVDLAVAINSAAEPGGKSTTHR